MRVLLIEDDRMIGESLEESLRHEGYAVDWVADGEAALLALRSETYDAILLDLGLPRRHGLEVLAQYRDRGGSAPVLIITARDGVADRVRGLDAGADDYLIKPFELEELFARLRAMIRRRSSHRSTAIRCRGWWDWDCCRILSEASFRSLITNCEFCTSSPKLINSSSKNW